MLTLNDILKHKSKVIKAEFQEQEIYVKEFTPAIRQKFIEQKNYTEQQYVVITECLCNEDGTAFFKQEEKESIRDVSPEYLDLLFSAIMEVLNDASDEKKIAKN